MQGDCELYRIGEVPSVNRIKDVGALKKSPQAIRRRHSFDLPGSMELNTGLRRLSVPYNTGKHIWEASSKIVGR